MPENFDDIFTETHQAPRVAPSPPAPPPFDPEAYKARKEQERRETYEKLDTTTDKLRYSTNWQLSGRELMLPEEVRMLDNKYALLFIRGERPVMDFKYNVLHHPNVTHTTDGGQPPFEHGTDQLSIASISIDPALLAEAEQFESGNLDASDLIGRELLNLNEQCFYNIDPPYVVKGKSLYSVYYAEQDHRAFRNTVRQYLAEVPWIMTYDNCELIRELYNDCTIQEFELFHSAHNRAKGNELVITNIAAADFEW